MEHNACQMTRDVMAMNSVVKDPFTTVGQYICFYEQSKNKHEINQTEM